MWAQTSPGAGANILRGTGGAMVIAGYDNIKEMMGM